MATTAEGVETQEQLDALAVIGCTEVQGYLFSPAVPGSQVPDLLSRLPAMIDASLGHGAVRLCWPWSRADIPLAQACADAVSRVPYFAIKFWRCRSPTQHKGFSVMAYDINEAAGDATAQIARLREQVETLMKDRVTPALADAAGRAESAFHTAADSVRGQAETVSGKVREQPLLAVLIAAAIGYALGRVTR